MKRNEFPLQGSITYEKVGEAHKRLLRIALEVRDVLERHHIPYSIFFGTVLGAVRHQGFIPWDLDMDFGAFDNYEETIKILKQELPSWLVVQDSDEDINYCASWVKIVDKYSEFHATMFEGDNSFKHRGLHVDLYNIGRTTYNNACEFRKDEALAYYQRKYDRGLITEDSFNSLCLKVNKSYEKELLSREKLSSDKVRYAFINLFESDEDAIFPLRKYEFEGEFFMGPNNYDKFLKSCYYKGDYMELPPYEKRDMKMDEIKIYPIPD